MTHWARFFICSATVLLVANPVKAQEKNSPPPSPSIFNNFSSCNGVIDGTPFALDFFEELDPVTEVASGKGYVVQTMGPIAGPCMKMMSHIKVTTSAAQSAKIVEMFAVLDPSVSFATFSLDQTKKSTVKIFSSSFKALWGNLNCDPHLIPSEPASHVN